MAVIAPHDLTAAASTPTKIVLHWINGETYNYVQIWRKPSGGTYAALGSIAGSSTSYSDASCADGTKYYYKILGVVTGVGVSGYSNEANATTPLPAPSGLSGYSDAGGTEAPLTWDDNSQNEASFKVYKNGALLYTTAANAESYTATGLTPGATYTFIVKAYNSVAGLSPASNTLSLTMADPPAKPTLLTATATGTTTAQLNWKDNSDNEVDFHIEKSSTSATAGFSQIATVGANVKTYPVTGLTTNTQYWFRVRAHNASGYSAYSNVATAVTFAAIAAPSNLALSAAKVNGAYGVEIIFVDNSELEDSHIIERKDSGAYAALVTLAPNRTYYHDDTAAAGTTYTYRIRAKQGADTYSSYCEEVAIDVPDVPAAPGSLSIPEYQDTWARLAWTPASAEVGYSIEMSTTSAEAGFAEVIRMGIVGAEGVKVSGLDPSVQHWFRVLAYNGAGDSDYTDVETVTTRAAYLPSKFEKLIRRSNPRMVYLIEANPAIELGGWILTDGATYTYERTPSDPIVVQEICENGVKLQRETWLADVETYPGTWYQDSAGGTLYLHTLSGDDPANVLVMGVFRMCFRLGGRGDFVFNGDNYLPLLPADGIPDISQAIQPYYEGSFSISSGTVGAVNARIQKAFRFDTAYAKYNWLNRRVRILGGAENFDYADFRALNTGLVNAVFADDRRMSLELRDAREAMYMDLPTANYSLDVFPLMEESAGGREWPYGFGPITNAPAVCIDTTNHVFNFQHGRVKSVSVTLNAAALTENTHYFVNYREGSLTLARGLTFSTGDALLVSFTGNVNEADEALNSGSEIFLYLCTAWLGCRMDEMDLDAIYDTKAAHPEQLSLNVRKLMNSKDYIRTIELSIQAYSMQDAEGRLGIRAEQSAPASGAPFIWDCQVFDFQAQKTSDRLYSIINIYYGENPANDIYLLSQTLRPTVAWRYGMNKSLSLYTALASEGDAAALGAAIADSMERPVVSFSVPRVLFGCLPGDVILFSRKRFPSLSGTAAGLSIKILEIAKLVSSGRTEILAEVVE